MNFKRLLKPLAFIAAISGFWASTASAQTLETQSNQTLPAVSNGTYSGPYTHENLTVFLVHGKDQMPGRSFLTLEEAMKSQKVVVHETSNVNELALENVSAEEIYIQAGDIVKGGKQDRTISIDFILQPKSGKVQISAFCVESGRWRPRGSEDSNTFSVSSNQVSGKSMKMAVRKDAEQGEVWSEVIVTQKKLKENLKADVAAAESPSSLNLTLDNKVVQESVEKYVLALSKAIDGKSDVIGYVFSINGELNSADLYGSSQLFKKLWPKLLKATAVEAIAELKKDKTFPELKTEAIDAMIKDAEAGRIVVKEISPEIKFITKETEKNILFETQESKKGLWIHKNYLTK